MTAVAQWRAVPAADGLVVWGLLASTLCHAGGLAIYAVTRPVPPITIVVQRPGPGQGDVVINAARPVAGAQGATVEMLAPIWHCADKGRCVASVAPGTRVELIATPGSASTFRGWRGDACEPHADVLRCGFVATTDATVAAQFGEMPKELEVSWELPLGPDRDPADANDPKRADKRLTPRAAEIKPIEIAMVKMPTPVQIKLRDLSQPPPPPQPPIERRRMKSVEVADDNNEVVAAQDDATHLSDKNRDVAEETLAKNTNLDRIVKGEQNPTAQSDDRSSTEVGGPDDQIAQLDETKASTLDRAANLAHSGHAHVAQGLRTGDGGDNGQAGTGPAPGALAMRGIGGRGSLAKGAGDGKTAGKKGAAGVKLRLSMSDYERIIGKERALNEAAVAKRKRSTRQGRWDAKMTALRSEVENFTSAVQTGNQTALKTRADPFAQYMARMHRQIHEVWGYGYLVALDRKATDHPLNDSSLVAVIEVAINPDGTLFKKGIYRSSGKTEFDVAALTSVGAAGPFETTPPAIRSVDQRVYARWTFHRDDRMCASDYSDMFILSAIPGGIVPLDAVPNASDADGLAVVVNASASGSSDPAGGASAARAWAAAWSGPDLASLVKASRVPFASASGVVTTADQLNSAYDQLRAEVGAIRQTESLSAAAFLKKSPSSNVPPGAHLLLVEAERGRFGVVFEADPDGSYRATQLVRGAK